MDKKIILFNPLPEPAKAGSGRTVARSIPYVNVPLSLLAIARMVSQDFEVKIFNAVVDADYKERILEECSNALCLGVSSMTCYQIVDGLLVSEAVKREFPECPVIWGGYHPSSLPEQTLKDLNIDIVVRGQGEETFKELVWCLSEKRELSEVRGITYKKDGKIISNPLREFSKLDRFPTMPYQLIDVERHLRLTRFGKRCIDFVSSQGCAAECYFCSEPIFCGRRWSGLSPERTVGELDSLHKEYHIDTFMIRDTDFFLDVKRVREICSLILERGVKVNLTSVNGRMERLKNLDNGTWELMRRAGVREILIGAESGYQAALNAMGKGAKAEDILVCTEKCSQHNIGLRASFMVGIPGINSREEIKHTFAVINRMIEIFEIKNSLENLDVSLSIFVPRPSTPLYEKALELGLAPPKTLVDWADLDTYDFEGPWMPKKYIELVKDFRTHLPCNSNISFREWKKYYREEILNAIN